MTASFPLTLDTRAPTLDVAAPSSVVPPEDVVITVTSDEDLGPVSVALEDALGTLTQLGHVRVDDRTVAITVSSVGLATGPASLHLAVADEVLNVTYETVRFTVDRARAFDVSFTVERGHEVEFTLDEGYDAELTIDRAHTVTLEVRR